MTDNIPQPQENTDPQELIDKMNKRERDMVAEYYPPPKSAYELYMEARKNHADVSIWFTDDNCPLCKMPIYTDGLFRWCKRGCKNHGDQPGTYAAFQEDYVR